MPQKAQTFSQFQAKSLNFLGQQTGLSNFAPGSTIRSIVDAMSLQSAQLSSDISNLSLNAFLDTASGYYLDLIGEMFGLERFYGASNYKTTAGDKTIKFYVTGVNTLSKVLGSNVIPVGTTISTADNSISFTVDNTVEFNDTDTFVFVAATANASDSTINLGPDQLIRHTINNSNLFVTNTNGIYYDSGAESDALFKDRIANAILASEGPNESNIISALRRFSDVSDVIIRPNVSGAGTYDVFLLPVANRISLATLNSAAGVLNQSGGFGISGIIREFDYVPIKLEVKVTFNNQVQDSAKEQLLNAAESAVQATIGSLLPGQKLSMSRVSTLVLNTSNSFTSAEIVYLCIDKKVRAITDLLLEEDELFVPDPDEINPIMVRQ